MARINLLPWREERRRQKQQQFFIMLGLAVAVSGALMGGVHAFVQASIDFQRERNVFLETEIKKLDEQIKEINQLESTKKRLLARIEIIQRLQSSRPEFVHLVDELSRTLPEGVYLTKLVQADNKITVDGVAQSNARVSTYMWNIEKSTWLDNPNLEVIRTAQGDKGDTARISQFVLQAVQSHPTREGETENNK